MEKKYSEVANINQKELERLRTLLSGADIENKELKIKIDGFELNKRERQNIEFENVRFRELIEK